MADVMEQTTTLVVREDLESLRSRITIPDTISKTRKFLQAQIQEKIASIESFKGQVINIQGMMEMKTEELEELKKRLAKLETINE